MTKNINRTLSGAALAVATLAVVALSALSIDWSSFTDALTGIVPDAVALAAVLVGGAMTVALVFKGGKAVIAWGTKFVR